ncbi:hypothetical protein H4Q26_017016 [Puccinia striiformis f. sp. tritici PST-130]|nr:hypothetical protein H4Q26_017016 [Puccinia striiformis f. sp. tritici PST-130]
MRTSPAQITRFRSRATSRESFDADCPSSAWTLIALLNKVVGFYDILAIFHGAHLTQVDSQRTYLHNILTIGLVIYGLQATEQENPRRSCISEFTIMRSSDSDFVATQAIWKEEGGFASAIVGLVWLTKLHFIFVVYSFALHLRQGSYTTLPLSRPPSTISTTNRLRAFSRSLNPSSTNNNSRNSSAYTYSQLRNPTSTTILPSSSSSDDPAVFRPRLDDHHLPGNIRAGSTDLGTNNSSNNFS